MSYKVSSLIILLFVFLGITGGYFAAEKKYAIPQYSTLIFSTLVSSDKSSSVLDKEAASTWFGETIIGWTLSPQFTASLGFHVDARKQERQNIVFQFTTDSEKKAKEQSTELKAYLLSRVYKYNVQSKTNFSFIFEQPLTELTTPKKWMWSIAGAIAGFFAGIFISEVFRYIRRKK